MLSVTSHIGLEFLTKFLNMSKLQNRLILLYQSLPLQEVFFLRMRFHSMRQSDLKVRANKQVDKDAQRIGGRFLDHSTVF